jgi:hypothetical protein
VKLLTNCLSKWGLKDLDFGILEIQYLKKMNMKTLVIVASKSDSLTKTALLKQLLHIKRKKPRNRCSWFVWRWITTVLSASDFGLLHELFLQIYKPGAILFHGQNNIVLVYPVWWIGDCNYARIFWPRV